MLVATLRPTRHAIVPMGSTSKIVDSYLAVIALLRSEQHVMASVGWVVSTRFDLVFHKPLERWPINWAKFNFGWRAESASTHTAPHALAPHPLPHPDRTSLVHGEAHKARCTATHTPRADTHATCAHRQRMHASCAVSVT
jgi:hypothetical protein